MSSPSTAQSELRKWFCKPYIRALTWRGHMSSTFYCVFWRRDADHLQRPSGKKSPANARPVALACTAHYADKSFASVRPSLGGVGGGVAGPIVSIDRSGKGKGERGKRHSERMQNIAFCMALDKLRHGPRFTVRPYLA